MSHRQDRVESKGTAPIRRRVLLIDDDVQLTQALSLYLRLEGYDVTSLDDGAIALCEVGLLPPHAIITDVRLPVVDGISFCRRLRTELGDRTTPVIAFTGLTEPVWRYNVLAAGANAFLSKPCDFSRLSDLLETLISAPLEWESPEADAVRS